MNPGPYPTGAQPYPPAGAQPYPPMGGQPYPYKQRWCSLSQQAPFPAMAGANMAAGGLLKNTTYIMLARTSPLMGWLGFDDTAVRQGFIRKVYGILMCQLLVTGAINRSIPFCLTTSRCSSWRNMWVYWTSFGVMFVCLISCLLLLLRRKALIELCVSWGFSLCEGFMMGVSKLHSTMWTQF